MLVNLGLEVQLHLLTILFHEELPGVFHRPQAVGFKCIEMEQDAKQEDMGTEDQCRAIHNFREGEVVARSGSVCEKTKDASIIRGKSRGGSILITAWSPGTAS